MSTHETATTGSDLEGVRASRPLEIAFAIVALAFTATYLALSTGIELRQAAAPGQIDARFWPLLLGTSGVAAAVALLVFALIQPAPSRDDLERIQRGGVLRVVLTCAVSIGYVALWSLSAIVAFGYRTEIFPIVTAVYMLLLLLIFGHRRWVGLVVYPLAITIFIYVLFGIFLRIPL